MRLEDLCESFESLALPLAGEEQHPDLETVRLARAAVEMFVTDDEFVVDCIARELDVIAMRKLRRGLEPFMSLPGTGVEFGFGYWAPGFRARAHEHTAWTVTAVCRNELDVVTFDRHESYRRGELVPKNRFKAAAGRAGYIGEPAIHQPLNTSVSWSLSLHVNSPLDGRPLDDCPSTLAAVMYPATPVETDHPYWSVLRCRQRLRSAHLMARVLRTTRTSRTQLQLARCERLGGPSTRRFIQRTRTGEKTRHERTVNPSVALRRVHPALNLRVTPRRGQVWLDAETPEGFQEELVVNGIGGHVFARIVASDPIVLSPTLECLSSEEVGVLAYSLEESGLFCQVDG